jgi:hypothetical protein
MNFTIQSSFSPFREIARLFTCYQREKRQQKEKKKKKKKKKRRNREKQNQPNDLSPAYIDANVWLLEQGQVVLRRLALRLAGLLALAQQRPLLLRRECLELKLLLLCVAKVVEHLLETSVELLGSGLHFVHRLALAVAVRELPFVTVLLA